MPPFKDAVDAAAVGRLAAALGSGIDGEAFVAEAVAGLDELELKARVAHVARALGRHLPSDFLVAAAVVERTVPAGDLGMWEVWPVTDWVAAAGLDHPEAALALLARLTSKASGEFAVRPFIDRYPALAYEVFTAWTADPDEHVRRLVSEGTRPRLPWAPRVPLLEREPGWAVPLLDRLRDDPSAFVRRSVANHLNDLAKADPDLAMSVAQRWAGEGGSHAAAVVRHGLRTLVKAGVPAALALVGADVDADVRVEGFEVLTPVVELGRDLVWACRLVGDPDRPVAAVVDYVVHFAGARGGLRPKVFKLTTVRLAPGAAADLRRRHPIVPVTTRRYYPGRHRVEVQVNGRVLAGADFDLVSPPPRP